MAFYETVFMSRQELSSKQVEQLTEEMSAFITNAGGKIHKVEQWGLMNLAYRINKSRKANYTLIEMDASAEALHEMERNMRLNEDIIRYMTIKLEELSDAPSVIMNKGSKAESKEVA